MSVPRKERIVHAPAHADEDCIRVRLDHRTIVLIKSMEKFAYWKARYPNACVIDPEAPKATGEGPSRPRKFP
ncbi:MAG TPA: hypothetical protein VGE21_00940 [Flavobacteriales bacterium]